MLSFTIHSINFYSTYFIYGNHLQGFYWYFPSQNIQSGVWLCAVLYDICCEILKLSAYINSVIIVMNSTIYKYITSDAMIVKNYLAMCGLYLRYKNSKYFIRNFQCLWGMNLLNSRNICKRNGGILYQISHVL